MCIGLYAVKKSFTHSQAYKELFQAGAIEFLSNNYNAEHMLSIDDVLNDFDTLVNRKMNK